MIKIVLIIMIMIMTNMISVVIEKGGSHCYSHIVTLVTMVTMTMPARRMKWKVE